MTMRPIAYLARPARYASSHPSTSASRRSMSTTRTPSAPISPRSATISATRRSSRRPPSLGNSQPVSDTWRQRPVRQRMPEVVDSHILEADTFATHLPRCIQVHEMLRVWKMESPRSSWGIGLTVGAERLRSNQNPFLYPHSSLACIGPSPTMPAKQNAGRSPRLYVVHRVLVNNSTPNSEIGNVQSIYITIKIGIKIGIATIPHRHLINCNRRT